MFNFFKKQPKEEPIEEHILLPSITSDDVDCSLIYYIKKDGEICLDVDIDSHEESTIANLAKLTTAVASEACQVETLNMIKVSTFGALAAFYFNYYWVTFHMTRMASTTY